VSVDLEDDGSSVVGQDRRGAMALAFTLCLAVGSAFLGRDGPVATHGAGAEAGAERAPMTMLLDATGSRWVSLPSASDQLSLPLNTTDVLLSAVPERLANEAWPPLLFVPVRVRAVAGMASEGLRPGDYRMVTWTELGNEYWLVSSDREIADLVKLADSLR